MLRQLTSSELSELIAYSELHPISPGLERQLARGAHMAAVGGGVTADGEPIPESSHLTRKFPDEI